MSQNNQKMEIEQIKEKDENKIVENYILDEDDDDFEEFEIDENAANLGIEEKIDIKLWQEDWGDEAVDDHFSEQLRMELK